MDQARAFGRSMDSFTLPQNANGTQDQQPAAGAMAFGHAHAHPSNPIPTTAITVRGEADDIDDDNMSSPAVASPSTNRDPQSTSASPRAAEPSNNEPAENRRGSPASGSLGAAAPAPPARRGFLLASRAEMSRLSQTAGRFSPNRLLYNAYSQAYLAKYYTTVGKFLWLYSAPNDKFNQLRKFRTYCDPMQVPAIVVQSLSNDINQLEQEGGVVDFELGVQDLNEEDEAIPDVMQTLGQTQTELNTLLVNGAVFMADSPHLHTLDSVHFLVKVNISFYHKMEMLAKAMVIWPEEVFDSDSDALAEFITANHEYLCEVRAQEGTDSVEGEVAGQEVTGTLEWGGD